MITEIAATTTKMTTAPLTTSPLLARAGTLLPRNKRVRLA